MISQKEFDAVAKISALQIADEHQASFRHKMEQVIDMIDPLRSLDIDQMRYDLGIAAISQPSSGYPDLHTQALMMDKTIFLDNIQHQVINDSIVIKSSLAQSGS